jgi:hypothetical protein
MLLNAQQGIGPFGPSSNNQEGNNWITAEFGSFNFSNSLNNQFVNALYSGGFIDEGLKSGVKLNDENFLLSDTKIAFNYFHTFRQDPDKFTAKWGVGLKSRYFAAASYSNDYFNLIFRGNSFFEGTTADLSNSDLYYLNYQGISAFSLNQWESEDLTIDLNIGVSLLKGQDLMLFELNEARVATSSLGEEVGVYVDYLYFNSDTNSTQLTSNNGLGFGADLQFAMMHKKSKLSLNLFAEDLGAINFNKDGVIAETQTGTKLNATNIQLFPDFNMDMGSVLDLDTLTNTLYENHLNDGSVRLVLPATFGASLTKGFDHKLIRSLGVAYMQYMYPENAWITKTSVGLSITDVLTSEFTAGYYSTGIQFISIGVQYLIMDKVYLRCSYGDLIGIAAPEKAYSQQFSASASYMF